MYVFIKQLIAWYCNFWACNNAVCNTCMFLICGIGTFESESKTIVERERENPTTCTCKMSAKNLIIIYEGIKEKPHKTNWFKNIFYFRKKEKKFVLTHLIQNECYDALKNFC